MRPVKDKITKYGTGIIGLFSVLLLIFINLFILKESIPAIREVGLSALFGGGGWHPLNTATPTYSIRNMLLSTLYVTALAVCFAFIIGVGCSVFLTVGVSKKQRGVLLPVVELLASIPSVVYGFIGFSVVVKLFERLGMAAGESVLAGAIVLALMLLPYVISSCCHTMAKVEEKYLLSSEALGISKWYMMSKLVLPRSLKGILVSVVLATGRAMGETMAVMMVMGNAISAPSLLGKGETLSSLIALEMGAAEVGSLHFSALYFAGLTLMLLLILINILFFFLDRLLLRSEG